MAKILVGEDYLNLATENILAADLILEKQGDQYKIVKHRNGVNNKLISKEEAAALCFDVIISEGGF